MRRENAGETLVKNTVVRVVQMPENLGKTSLNTYIFSILHCPDSGQSRARRAAVGTESSS
jgi:hypothetical protein